MGSYPAAKRKGLIDVLAHEENERLYDRGLTRATMNDLMERLQAKLGSKNKLGEAIFSRRLAASAIKRIMEGSTRYTDTVIDQVLKIAAEHGVPKITSTPAEPANDQSPSAVLLSMVPDAPEPEPATTTKPLDPSAAETIGEDAVPPAPTPEIMGDAGNEGEVEDVTPPVAAPTTAEDDAGDRDEGNAADVVKAPTEAPADPIEPTSAPADWLDGVRGRRAEKEAEAADLEADIDARVLRIAEMQTELAERKALRDEVLGAMREIDGALAILQAI